MRTISLALAVLFFATAAEAEPKRFIVKVKDGPAAATALAAAGAKVKAALPRHQAVAARIPAQALAGLRRHHAIEYIEEDVKRYALAETVPYGIPMVQANLLSDANSGNMTVCIIDSGYHVAHEDLQDVNVDGTNDAGTGNWFEDECGHGTHVAGTVAALANGKGVVGVNPSGNINLHIVKVFSGSACDWTYSSTLVQALDACTAAGANVVSMSLGGSFKSRTEQQAFAAAYAGGVLSVAAAGNDGNTRKSYPASYSSVVSVAAIDSSKVIADFSQQNSEVELAAPGVGVLSTVPWLASDTVTVSGTAYTGGHIEYSAYGTTSGDLVDGGLCDATGPWSGNVVLCERGNISFYEKVMNVEASGGVAALIYNNEPGGFLGTLGDGNSSAIIAISLSQEDGQTLVAGELGQSATVVSTFEAGASGYEAWDGTSMATPHVSGVAALVWSHFPMYSNVQIRDALDATAEDLGAPGRDVAYGYGLVQAQAAYDYLSGSVCTPSENPEVSCDDGMDNDCDGQIDGDDPDCGGSSCDLGQRGDSCVTGADCCSGKCTGRRGSKTCK